MRWKRGWLGHLISVLAVVVTVLGGLYGYTERNNDRHADDVRAIGVLQTQQSEIGRRLDRQEERASAPDAVSGAKF